MKRFWLLQFWLLQFIANALLIAVFYEWLGIRDSRISQLLLSAVIGLALIAGTVWLHSRTFNVKPLRFALILVIFLLICWGLSALPLYKAAVWIASTLTFRSRKPINPGTVLVILNGLRWTLQWIIVPLILLRNKRPIFWLQFAAVVLVAFLIPHHLIGWTPRLSGTAAQVTSFALRFGTAYCLAITGFVAFARLTSSGSPALSQPITTPLP
jgi:hypothetical protein